MSDATYLPSTALAAWHHRPRTVESSPILPDGCRDLILHVRPGMRPAWYVSPLMDTVQFHVQQPGESLWGLRLAPGACIYEAALLAAVRGGRYRGMDEALSTVDAFCRRSPGVSEALDALALSGSVRDAARGVGLSERSLGRLVRLHTSRPPVWWRNLARARRAASRVDDGTPLADVAADQGFADQAHMTREFRRWFGAPPTRFRASRDLMATVRQSGFGEGAR